MDQYDYIVVGAGSAGCVLAARLSEDPGSRVLLLEAGGRDRNPLYRFPMFAGRLYRSRMNNWYYHTAPQPHLDGRRVFMPRGRMLGGSFIFNGMVYIRGQAEDYDHWAQLGNRGWSYAEVLPYFKRSEAHEGGESSFHGGDGPLVVRRGRSRNPLFEAFEAAGQQAGHPLCPDFNGASQEGFGRYDFTIRDGRRWNTASAFLKPAMTRPNLRVETGALACRLLLQEGRVSGVAYLQGGVRREAAAAREVILAAGAINTPQLLMLSGIGPGDALRALGIDVHLEVPEVGRNLQDHPDVTLAWACSQPVSLVRHLRLDRFALRFLEALLLRRGPVADSAIEGGCFLRLGAGAASPDAQAHFMPIHSNGARLRLPFQRPRSADQGDTFGVRIGPTRPRSRGWVALASPEPQVAPEIQPLYFSDPSDLWIAREGVRAMREVVAQPAFDAFRGAELAPGADCVEDSEIEAWCRTVCSTVHHPVGTARMGSDPGAVVDDRLRVRGIGGLRIADASIMPTLVSGNTNAATIMIAEKAADLIRDRAAPPPAAL